MIIIKIIFWAKVIGVFIDAMHASENHPRITKSTTLGGDLTAFILSLVIAIWLGIAIWMPHIFQSQGG